LRRNVLGKEFLEHNICPKTFTNFRRRLLEYEEDTGRDLLHEVFEDHREYLQNEFDIDAGFPAIRSTVHTMTMLRPVGNAAKNTSDT
jgi:hypothetical protein